MILRFFTLMVACLFVFPSLTFAEKVPFPDWYYSEYEYSYPEEVEMYRRKPVIVSGDPKLHPSTNAFLLAPRAMNANFVHKRRIGELSYEEYNSRWSWWIFDWNRWLMFDIELYSDDPYWATTGLPTTGPIIQYIILETSDGYREVRDDIEFLLPEKQEGSSLYKLIFYPSFSKEARESRPEWIRLTLKGEDFEYYFHWDFEI